MLKNADKLQRKHAGKAVKYDGGKVRPSLVPMEALLGVAQVMTHGAIKYEAFNWCKGFSFTKLLDSAFRHLIMLALGENIDPDSGQPHADHLTANSMMLREIMEHYPELDDRFTWKKQKEKNVNKTSTKSFSKKKNKKTSNKKTPRRRKTRR